MKSKMNLKFGIILSLCTMLILGACSSSNQSEPQNSGTSNPDQSTNNPAPETEEPLEISWLSFDFPETDDSLVQQWMEERFNITIKNIRIDRANWKDQLNIRLATNELPDVWLLWGMADVRTYMEQGLLGELPVDEIKTNIPLLGEFIDEQQPLAWKDGLIDGKNYGIPITNLEGVIPMHPLYNKAWLEAIGMEQPPSTLTELEDVLYKFRDGDPNQSGRKDTYGLTANGSTNPADSLQYVFGAFHTHPNFWLKDEQGGLVYGMTTERTREAFRLLNKWFNDGVLDPEFLTNDGKREEFLNGIVGVTSANWGNFRASGSVGRAAAGSGFEFVAGKALEGPYGAGQLMAYGLTGNYFGMSIDAVNDPRKKSKIYEILNAFYSDEEAFFMSQFGVQGEHYEMVDGMPVALDAYLDNKARINLGMGNYYGLLSRKARDFEKFLIPASELAYRDELAEGVDLLFNQVKFSVPAISKYPDLPNIEKEYFIKLQVMSIWTAASINS